MKYEFYVGDYVETKDGKIGYITEVKFSGEDRRWYSILAMCKQNNSIISFEGYEDLIPNNFNRIGRYDFTKKNVDKIAHLMKSRTDSTGKFHIVDFREVIDKINEIVNAVNELGEKVK